jgi:hypothetical protein
MSSGTTAVVIVVVIVVIAIAVATSMVMRRRRLQQQFGPEYDRAVAGQNSRLRAEAELAERQRRVRKLDIKPLGDQARERYSADWVVIQERFVDAPEAAVGDAYLLVTTVMRERGYPTENDDQVLSDLSVEHARAVGHFRSAQELSGNAAGGDAVTEDLRQALIHYRALFSDLLGQPVPGQPAAYGTAVNGTAVNGIEPSSTADAGSTAAPTATTPHVAPVQTGAADQADPELITEDPR